jgi:hypothetical protein
MKSVIVGIIALLALSVLSVGVAVAQETEGHPIVKI